VDCRDPMSTPLLPEAVLEIDANPVSVVGGGSRGVSTHESVHLLEFV